MKKHFLVVDDSELNLRVVQALLDRYGIQADYVTSAEHAFTALSEADYDLVLMDYLMPGTNGIEATSIIRKMNTGHSAEYYGNLPIIVLTAEDNKDLIDEMFRNGINDVLSKPIQPGNFTSIVEKWAPTVHGIEESTLMSMLDADRSSYIELVSIFCQDIDGKHARIEEALANKDYESYTVEVHKIKGEAKVIGATALAEAAKILEFTGKALTGTIPNGRTDAENIKTICNDTPKVMKALDDIGRELGALIEEYRTTVTPESEAAEATDAAVVKALRPELEKIERYVNHALEALDSDDRLLTHEWLEEIAETVAGLLK